MSRGMQIALRSWKKLIGNEFYPRATIFQKYRYLKTYSSLGLLFMNSKKIDEPCSKLLFFSQKYHNIEFHGLEYYLMFLHAQERTIYHDNLTSAFLTWFSTCSVDQNIYQFLYIYYVFIIAICIYRFHDNLAYLILSIFYN